MSISTSSISSPTPAGEGFAAFPLDARLLRAIAEAGYTAPRPIQGATLPAALAGRDVLGLAQTGTGKTAAFALPILQRLLTERKPGPRALVLAPTRELALQIEGEFRSLARFTPLRGVTIFGGVAQRVQVEKLRRRPEVVVGCPGRVLDLLEQRLLDLSKIEMLVLDEADHMFDMGFLPDVKRIVAALPKQRQNLLFSATMPREIRHLTQDLLRDPEVVEREHGAPAATIEHALYPIAEGRKQELLERLLGAEECRSAIVFTRTKQRAKRLAQHLEQRGHRAVGLQGNMSQAQRDRAMQGFRAQRFDVLVATDIAARGIDVSSVSHVINYDVPSTPDAYTHRIGRTGRAERSGKAFTFVTGADRGWLRDTERALGAAIPREHLPGFEGENLDSGHAPRSQPGRRPYGGRRSSSGRGRPSYARRSARA